MTQDDRLKPKLILPGDEVKEAGGGIDLSGTAHGQLELSRQILSMDELVRMKDVQPQFEKDMKLPGDSHGPSNRVYMFSINGMLDGKPVRGGLLAGECMLVQSQTQKQATRICREGLLDTIKIARAEYEDRLTVVTPDGVMQAGMTIEAAGNHGQVRASEDPTLLKSDPLMKNMLATVIGKLPWKH